MVETSSATAYTWVIDQAAPTVTNVTSPTANGAYKAGVVIPITVAFQRVGRRDRNANARVGDRLPGINRCELRKRDGHEPLTFNYTVAAGNASPDLNYVATNSLAGTIEDLAGNSATLTLPGTAAAGSLGTNKAIVIDTSTPTVTNVTSTTANGAYKAGIVIPITVASASRSPSPRRRRWRWRPAPARPP